MEHCFFFLLFLFFLFGFVMVGVSSCWATVFDGVEDICFRLVRFQLERDLLPRVTLDTKVCSIIERDVYNFIRLKLG